MKSEKRVRVDGIPIESGKMHKKVRIQWLTKLFNIVVETAKKYHIHEHVALQFLCLKTKMKTKVA